MKEREKADNFLLIGSLSEASGAETILGKPPFIFSVVCPSICEQAPPK